MSCVRYGAGPSSIAPSIPCVRGSGPRRAISSSLMPGDEEAAEAAVAVRDAERGVARARQLARAVDQSLQHLVDRALRRDGQHGVAQLAQRGVQAAFHHR